MRSASPPTVIEFKEALGPKAFKMSESEILRLNDVCEKMAGVLFDNWLKQISEKSSNNAKIEA